MPFSQKTLDFLFENRLHDSREWFREHQEDYQTLVIQPLKQLVTDLTPVMLELDDSFITEPRVDKTICRIWRDTRYTRDPSLYRDNMWIIFKRGGKMHGTDFPGVYFDISPDGFSYGCGFYHASTGYMETMRSLILEDAPEFRAAQKAYRKQNTFLMEGDCYKRPRYGAYPKPLQDWLERRGISFNAESHDFSLLFSPSLTEFLTEEFRKLFPVYRFLLLAAEQELRRETEQELLQR